MNINLQQRHNKEQCLNNDLNIFHRKIYGYVDIFSATWNMFLKQMLGICNEFCARVCM